MDLRRIFTAAHEASDIKPWHYMLICLNLS